MIKGNYGQSYQQSLNEIFASNLHKQQDLKKYAINNIQSLPTFNSMCFSPTFRQSPESGAVSLCLF